MFTGIVEELGKIKNIDRGSLSIKLTIECNQIMKDMKIGDSIAVNGICLTVTDYADKWFTADVMPETMRRTGLQRIKISDRVNLERALRLSDRLGGHIVSGHIDGTGIITFRQEEDNAIWLTIEAPPDIQKYIIMKGSVALDGTSLTVADVTDRSFKVSLIPLTAGVTNLGSKIPEDIVNIECDIIGKYVEKLISWKSPGDSKSNITLEFLIDNGFA